MRRFSVQVHVVSGRKVVTKYYRLFALTAARAIRRAERWAMQHVPGADMAVAERVLEIATVAR